MPRCPTCDRELDQAAEFCPFDGSALTGPPRARRPSDAGAISAKASEGSAAFALEQLQEKGRRFEDLIGRTLDGRYRVERVLGEGGMGVVFLAHHVVIEKPVAIKILKREAARNESVAKRFVREARAASRIGHPNIIDVTDFGTTEGGVTYSVMEYVEGAILKKVIASGAPLPAARVLHIAAQMARALVAAHGSGVVHRDLKPDNVFLVDRDGRPDFVKIVDFGIARMLPIPGNSVISRLTSAGSVFGTPEYMAPEQASGRTDSDHRVDVYALGTIMFEMLTGKVPHKGDSAVRTLAMQMLDPTPTLRDTLPGVEIDRELEALVMRALAKKREDRFADMAAMLDAILALQGRGETAPASAPTLAPAAVATPSAETVPEGLDPAAVAAASAETSVPVAAPTATSAPTQIYQSGPLSRPGNVDPALAAPTAHPAPRRLAPWLIGGAVLALVAAGAVAAVMLASGGGEEIAAAPPDAAAVIAGDAAADFDAGPLEVAALDAGAAAPPDAAVASGPGPRQRGEADPGSQRTPPRPGFLDVEVITRPEGGAVYVDGAYAGGDGVNVRRRRGSRVAIRCTKKGYQPGTVVVRYDGKRDLAVCRMKRRETKCVEGIKNPFEDCP